MNSPSATPTIDKLIVFVGLVCLLLGIYASGRIYINSYVLDKYPTNGVLRVTSFPTYGQREDDCSFESPYFSAEGKMRPATEEELKIEQSQKDRCISSIHATRQQAKIEDIGTAAFFLFLGVGILLSKKLFLR